MKNAPSRPVTRMFPIGTAAHNARWFATFLAGSSLMGGSAFAVNNLWNGGTTDWNTPSNWSLGRVPTNANGATTGDTFDDAVINTISPTYPILTASPSATPRDIRVGSAVGATGRVDQNAGVASTGVGNWMFVGVAGGTGSYNLANTSAAGGTFTGFGQGSGSVNAGGISGTAGRLYIGGDDAGTDAGNGTFNVHTTGTVTVRNDMSIGSQGGTGVFNMDSGTVTTGGWNFCGSGAGSNGTLRMSGGTLTNAGRFYFGDAGTATVVQSGGTLSNGSEVWIGNGATGKAEYTLSAGTLSAANWIAIGRESGQGTLNVSGGSVIKTGGGSFTMATGTNSVGTVNLTGGVIDIQSGNFYAGEGGTNTTANVNLSGTGELRAPILIVGNGGTATGNVNLDGGTLRTGQIDGGTGISNVTFNGTQIIATSVQPTFLSDIGNAVIAAGGLKVDSNGLNLTSAQSLQGPGGITKSGAGTLALTGSNSFTGPLIVKAGKLSLTPDTVGAGDLSVLDGAAFAANIAVMEGQLGVANATFGTGGTTTLEISYSNLIGNPSAAPLNVSGNLAINGTAVVNLTNSLPATGVFPLVKYTTKTGGNFVLGTVPNGVQATIIHDTVNKVYALSITSVALPRWNGNNSAEWDTTTINWTDLVSGNPSRYVNGNPVLFDDNATLYTVNLDTTVTPGGVTVNNNGSDYTLTSSTTNGKISGATGLLKQGTSALTIDLLNDYTGRTVLEGGTVNVAVLSNAGSPSGIGAATAAPENILLSGGTLNYTGAATTTNRGFTVGALDNTVTSTLILANDLTVSGSIVSGFGKFAKRGPGLLTLTNPGTNVLANGAGGVPGAVRIDEGGLVLQGSGTQVNTVTGEFWVGSTVDTAASLTLNATTLNTNSWLSIGRGNGTTGLTSTLTVTDSRLTTGNIALGFDAGVGGHLATSIATFNNSTFTTGVANISESAGSTGTLTLNGTSTMTSGDLNVGQNGGSNGTLVLTGSAVYNTANRVLVGNNTGAVGAIVVGGNATFNRTGGYTSIGVNATGTLTVQESGKFLNPAGDFNITDLAGSVGTLELKDSGTITAGVVYFGKADNTNATVNLSGGAFTGGSTYMAQQPLAAATLTQTGGVLNLGNNNEIFIAERGTVSYALNAGTFNATGWTVIGRYAGSNGTVNVAGGTLNHVMASRNIIVGEEGTGELTISGTGAVISDGNNGLVIGNGGTGTGTVNLDGGTLTVKSVHEGTGGASTLNLNGGLLKAAPSASAVFLTNVDTVNVEAGGARIDSNGQTIAINTPLLNAGGGGLTKTGAGTLELNAANTYTGPTLVSAGTLAGTGSIAGSLTVSAGAALAPGSAAPGLLTVSGNATLAGSYQVEISGTDADRLQVAGTLNVSAATLNVATLPAGATQPAYIVATYSGAVPAPFAAVNGLPAGYSVNYAYNDGFSSNNIAIVASGTTPYASWIAGFFPGSTDPAVIGATADPDKDGQSNSLEFALGGSPSSPTNNAKMYTFAVDSSADLDTTPELVLTIAVRSGTPAFMGNPSPSATQDGFTVTVEGSVNLDSFPTTATPVTPVTTDLPPAPTGYEYRSFALAGSNGLTSRGFLRVRVSQ